MTRLEELKEELKAACDADAAAAKTAWAYNGCGADAKTAWADYAAARAAVRAASAAYQAELKEKQNDLL